MNPVMNTITAPGELSPHHLVGFLQHARGIHGSEANYRAMLYRSLRKLGIDESSLEAEFPTASGHLIDLAVRSDDGCHHLFEIKGGAYGNRHALHDEIKAKILERDLKKLAMTGSETTGRWMIALDLSPIGGRLEKGRVDWLAEECTKRNIALLYFDFAESHAQIFPAKGERYALEIPELKSEGSPSLTIGGVIASDTFWRSVRGIRSGGHEQNQVLRLYEALLDGNVPARSISFETYFGFAKGMGIQGNKRPDIALFDPQLGGRFNLYRAGKSRESFDAIKLMKLIALIEVKASPSLNQALADITKLALWRQMIKIARASQGITSPDECRYIFSSFNTGEDVVKAAAARAAVLGIEARFC